MSRPIARAGAGLGAAMLALVLAAAPALACGGLIGPNGAVNLLRTTTLAAYHDGVEHYVTAFQFAGGGGCVRVADAAPRDPLERREGRRLDAPAAHPRDRAARAGAALRVPAASASDKAEELMKVRIDALDITVLRGGAAEVGEWATQHGFRLPPDAPEVLDFYAARSPDLPRRGLRCRRRGRAWPGGRRRDAGPHHDPDRQAVGPVADPGPGQGRRPSGSMPTSTS